MKKPMRYGAVILCGILVMGVLLHIPIWRADAAARRERQKVYQLVSVGQDLADAESKLKAAGYELFYDQPIKPSINKDYYQQLVIVGDTQPRGLESFAYAINASWMPYTRSESSIVIINAGLDGRIREVD